MNLDAAARLKEDTGGRLSVVILTYNESKHIERALKASTALNAKILIVDSFSTDDTRNIARAHGAVVLQHAFVNYAQQFQWALDHLPFDTAWIMRLDADEMLTTELIEEINRRLPTLPADVTGVNLKRRHIFLGRWIKHGGRYPLALLRIWRRGTARIEQRWMDEHMVLLEGRSTTFDSDFCDANLGDLSFFIDKHNKYATREAIDVLVKRYGLMTPDDAIFDREASKQAKQKRLLKERLYNELPFSVGPLAYFVLRYFFQGGIFDGVEGLIYHTLQGFWYRFLVGAKVWEYDLVLSQLSEKCERLRALETMTGHCLRLTDE